MKGEMQLKVIYWVTPIGLLGRGGEELATQGPSSVSCPVDSERRPPLVAHTL